MLLRSHKGFLEVSVTLLDQANDHGLLALKTTRYNSTFSSLDLQVLEHPDHFEGKDLHPRSQNPAFAKQSKGLPKSISLGLEMA